MSLNELRWLKESNGTDVALLIVFPSCETERIQISNEEFELLDKDQLIY